MFINKYDKVLEFTRILFNKFYTIEKTSLMDSAGRILFELQNEIKEDKTARFLVYTELYRLTKDENNAELNSIIENELKKILDDRYFIQNQNEPKIVRERIEKFATY